MRHLKILFLISICILAGCKTFISQSGTNIKTTSSPAQPATDPEAALELTMERTACYGTCPVYSVKVLPDGKIVFDGEKDTAVTGQAKADLTKEKKAQLIEAIDNADFFSLKDSYMGTEDDCPARATDASSVNLTIKLNGKEKTIKHYLGCVEEEDFKIYPEKLFVLERRIDGIIETERWIKSDK
jgi:hypothetical protein